MWKDDLQDFLKTHSSRADAIHEPAADTIIWKYLDLAKYLALLRSRYLHLAPTNEFCDRYEGDIGVVQKKALVERYGKKRYESFMNFYRVLRERTYVSCWTENEFESDAMWRIYTGAVYGVAIRSTYGRLKSVFTNASTGSATRETGLLTYIGRVNYVDFKKDLLNLESYHLPYFYKRRSFEHEREVRMLLQDVGSPNERSDIACSRRITLEKSELNHLITGVHLSPGAPTWFKDLVRDLNHDYGLHHEPVPSALDEVPEFVSL